MTEGQQKKINEAIDQVKKNLIERKVFTVNSIKERYLENCRKKEEEEENKNNGRSN